MPGTAKPLFTDCEFVSMQVREMVQALLACGRQVHFDAALVVSTRVALHQAGRLASRNQRHHAVMLGLQALGKLGHACPITAGKTFDLQHQLVLQR